MVTMSKQEKPAKEYTPLEIFNSYYWLVTHIDPYRIGLNTGFFNYIKCIPEVSTVYPYPPECLYTAIEEMGMKASNMFKGLSLEIPTSGLKTKEGKTRMVCVLKTKYNIEHEKGEAYTYGCGKRELEPLDTLDSLLKWHTKKIGDKGIVCVQTKDGKPVECVEDIKNTWERFKFESIDVTKIRAAHNNLLTEIMPMEADLKYEVEKYERRLNNYFVLQHVENLKELSQAETNEKGAGIEKEGIVTKIKSHWLFKYILGGVAFFTSIIGFFTNIIGFVRFIFSWFKFGG